MSLSHHLLNFSYSSSLNTKDLKVFCRLVETKDAPLPGRPSSLFHNPPTHISSTYSTRDARNSSLSLCKSLASITLSYRHTNKFHSSLGRESIKQAFSKCQIS